MNIEEIENLLNDIEIYLNENKSLCIKCNNKMFETKITYNELIKECYGCNYSNRPFATYNNYNCDCEYKEITTITYHCYNCEYNSISKKKLQFGKYKNMMLKDIPINYLNYIQSLYISNQNTKYSEINNIILRYIKLYNMFKRNNKI